MTTIWYVKMQCSKFPGFETRQILALLLIGIFCLPIADAATDTATDQTGTESQSSGSPQGSGSGETGDSGQSGGSEEKNSEESEEEPDC